MLYYIYFILYMQTYFCLVSSIPVTTLHNVHYRKLPKNHIKIGRITVR